jgi:HlyD family secretion protein
MTIPVRTLGVCAIVAVVALAALAVRPAGSAGPAALESGSGEATGSPSAAAGAAPASAPAEGTSSATGAESEEQTGGRRAERAAEMPRREEARVLPSPKGTLALLGSVQPATQATLSARVPSFVREVAVRDGQIVRPGELLIQLDDIEAISALKTARAALSAALAQFARAQAGRRSQLVKADADVQTARAAMRQAQIRLESAQLGREAAGSESGADLKTAQEAVRKARAGLERAQAALKSAQGMQEVGGISRSDLEGAESQVVIAQADLATAREAERRASAGPSPAKGSSSFREAQSEAEIAEAKAGAAQAAEGLAAAIEGRKQALSVADQDIAAARAGVEQARAGLEGASAGPQQDRLISPIGGIVNGVNVHRGEVAQPGAPLVTVVSLDRLRVDALVPARELPGLHEGQSALVSVDSQPGRQFRAMIGSISRVAEPDGRTFRLKFTFVAPNSALHPGQSARITVLHVSK